MALRTKLQNQRLAKKIFTNLESEIVAACEGTNVPTAFLAGLVSVEDASLDPSATRFEPGIFSKLQRVRDGSLSQFNGITQSDIANASDAALRNLATSFGLTQIMGFHVIATFNNEITIADLRDPDQQLDLGVRFIETEAGSHLDNQEFDKVLRIHNTGKPNGVTFDPDYVPNALGVMSEYETLES